MLCLFKKSKHSGKAWLTPYLFGPAGFKYGYSVALHHHRFETEAVLSFGGAETSARSGQTLVVF